MTLKRILVMLAAGASVAALSGPAFADAVADAKAIMDAASKPNPPWDGPSSGPKAEAGKTIVYVSTDQRNGGARGAGEGVNEAAEKIGWNVRIIDGQGTVAARSSGIQQAIASDDPVFTNHPSHSLHRPEVIFSGLRQNTMNISPFVLVGGGR